MKIQGLGLLGVTTDDPGSAWQVQGGGDAKDHEHKYLMVYPISAGGLLKGRLDLCYTFWLFCHYRLCLVGVYDLY